MSEVKTRKGNGDSTMFNFPKGSKAKMKRYLDELNLEIDSEFRITMRDLILMGLSLVERDMISMGISLTEGDLVPNDILHAGLSKYLDSKKSKVVKVRKVLCETTNAAGDPIGHLVMEYSGKVTPVFFK